MNVLQNLSTLPGVQVALDRAGRLSRLLRRGENEIDGPTLPSADEWILALLYAPDPSGEPNPVPIPGEFTVRLGLFAVSKQLQTVSGRRSPFSFRPSERGPYDESVGEALERLESQGDIERQRIDHSKFDDYEYRLTEAGLQRIESRYARLQWVERIEIERVKDDYVLSPVGDLILYCESKDSSMFEGNLIR
ncbi:hypothetical protein RYH80_03455 [Halobaculum sp. MBLA0147]|uniref:hypothetical protein n=1 Tax=Halobaculum sp. MBLA0147 TaxID=3079934 RepID=UPI003524F880